ncbi:hypothetical protein DDB_G0285721 [Dictyostelium discoideum AX4]|uniref:Putative uncharacterized protein DDB_G0285721 n=1 Tax=Dictyostelium discoideum TaxID=44689 RepID=Y6677_DICDI|nr:hypothetical protein DDB_G0285721 [Dictyostelium discoideum AX4]Q54MQ9.1 RecName: Full=Putative uncharacterized protein DDB_G0285721 [Dictyostelium discoideum]EAL64698.1 hypothetical protein DDB_G0285721 [Dictyostelium discoideum AX4]|eukprot:XP_638234.1 hypothetical protein DDB_G0285721 [Dictyostelium discoideum AX4]
MENMNMNKELIQQQTDKLEYYYNLMLEKLCNMVIASNASEVHEITRSFCEVLSDYKKYTDGKNIFNSYTE